MKKFDFSKLDLTQEESNSIAKSISFYARCGIEISTSDNPEDNDLIINIKQINILDGVLFNRQELFQRAKDVFEAVSKKNKFFIHPRVFTPSITEISPEWIEEKMKEFGLSRHDIEKQLCLDKSSISLLFSGSRKMNKSMKAAVYYYFMVYELNHDRVKKTNETIQKAEEIINKMKKEGQ